MGDGFREEEEGGSMMQPDTYGSKENNTRRWINRSWISSLSRI
jgi:hypothetical protein